MGISQMSSDHAYRHVIYNQVAGNSELNILKDNRLHAFIVRPFKFGDGKLNLVAINSERCVTKFHLSLVARTFKGRPNRS